MTQSTSFSQSLSLPDGRCPPFDARQQAYGGNIEATAQGFTISQHRIPTVPEFCVAAWFDTNQNDKVDSGDAVGHLATPYPAQPSTFFGSNRYESPAVVLELAHE